MTPELSRPIPVDRLRTEVTETVTATPEQRVLLAKRFGIVALDSLSAEIRLKPENGLIRVSGHLEADVVQNCVVTLEPFASHVEDDFTTDFSEHAVEEGTEEGDALFDPDYEAPEPIEDGVIDIGELTAQFLALALDPYPRAPGVALERVWAGGEDAEKSPFAVLKGLKPSNDS